MTAIYLDTVLLEELREILEAEFPALLQTYVQDSQTRVQLLQQAMASANSEAVRTAAHSLKGSSANLGLVVLSGLCSQLEDAARAGDLAGKADLLTAVQQEQQRAVELLQSYL